MDELALGKRRYLVCSKIMFDSTNKILRALTDKRCKPDLQTCIANNKDKINWIKKVPHFKQVDLEENLNIDKWDISLLCWFLLNIVQVPEKTQLNDIRAIRNQLVHCSNFYLKEEQYQSIVELITSAVDHFKILPDLDYDLSKEVERLNKIDQDTKTPEPTISDLGLLSRWHRRDLEIMTIKEFKDEPSTTSMVKVNGYGRNYGNSLDQIIKPELIPSYLLEKGMASEESMALIQLIQSAAVEEYSSADFVWIGYDITMYKEKIPTIVVIYNSFPKYLQIQSRFLSFEVIKKEMGDLSTEAKYVADYEEKKSLQFTPEETKNLQKCINSNTERLMKEHSNLLIISASKVKSTCYGLHNASLQHQACVVLYVHLKGIIPLMEEPFPRILDGFPVDVRESMLEKYAKPTDFLETLMMGCKICTCYNTSGSLGGFVQLQSGGIGCLTCCHLFKTNVNRDCFPSNKGKVKLRQLNTNVYQPLHKEEFNIGNVVECIDGERYNNEIGVDAALIEITRRSPTSGRFPNADSPACGFSANNPMVLDSGEIIHNWEEIPKTCNIVKYGAATEHTIGLLGQVSFAARGYTCGYKPPFLSERKLLTKQIEVFSVKGQAFAEPGDSGSLVFAVTEEHNRQRIRALGMLVGGTKHGSVMVTPIWAVLGILRDKQLIKSSSSLLSFPLPPAASDSSESEQDSDEAGETTLPVRNNAVINELKSEVTEIKTKMNITDQKIEENHASIKGDLATKINILDQKIEENHASIKGDLETIIKHIIPKAAKEEIAHENNTEGENDLAKKKKIN